MTKYLMELVRALATDIDNGDMTEDEALAIIDAFVEASQR